MDLEDALRSTGAVREFRPDPVADEVVAAVLEVARFAPNGGNRQPWHVVVVKDRNLRRALRDVYLKGWYQYLAMAGDGLTPWAAVFDPQAEARAVAKAPEIAARQGAGPGGFAEHIDEVPVVLAVLADMRRLAAVDRDLDRYSFAGGASIYPFAWSILLAARAHGLGGVITTMVVRNEPEVKQLLSVPDEMAVAAVIALGYPSRQPTRLRRKAVRDFATVDRFDGPAFSAAGPGEYRK